MYILSFGVSEFKNSSLKSWILTLWSLAKEIDIHLIHPNDRFVFSHDSTNYFDILSSQRFVDIRVHNCWHGMACTFFSAIILPSKEFTIVALETQTPNCCAITCCNMRLRSLSTRATTWSILASASFSWLPSSFGLWILHLPIRTNPVWSAGAIRE